jgi:hypothetical protein
MGLLSLQALSRMSMVLNSLIWIVSIMTSEQLKVAFELAAWDKRYCQIL